VQLAPWEYLFEPFAAETFPDLYAPTWISAIVMLVATVVLYNIRTRQLHRHRPYLDLYEWMLWTGVVTFSLLVIYAIFRFDFVIVLSTELAGLAVLVWIRFVRFPPSLTAYRQRLAKQRYLSRQRFAKPEATIRSKPSRRRRRR
jgi:hypothetical protein